MRKYIRHPSDIPIEFDIEGLAVNEEDFLNDISFGGLSFKSRTRVKPGSIIIIKIPFVNPGFESKGKVSWCRKQNDYYNVGVSFINPQDAFQTRMVEQICHIEHYKREILEKEGRELTSAEAAQEWISRFAERFPAVEQEEQ